MLTKDEQGRTGLHPTLHLVVSIVNTALTIVALVFWLGVDHQRINTLETLINMTRAEHAAQIERINEMGTYGTKARLDDLDKRLDRIERKIDRLQ